MSLYITKATDTDFCAIYEDMQQQFPYVEIKAKETFLTFLCATDYHIWLAKDDQDGKAQNVGYMLVWLDKVKNLLWLEYIAVFKEYHNRGVGSQMLRALKELYPKAKGCFLELEKAEPGVENIRRRVAFYTRKGAFPLNIRYFYPQRTGALELDLYFLPFKPGLHSLPLQEAMYSIRNASHTLHRNVPHARDLLRRITPLAA